jgi:hypothetical protein
VKGTAATAQAFAKSAAVMEQPVAAPKAKPEDDFDPDRFL